MALSLQTSEPNDTQSLVHRVQKKIHTHTRKPFTQPHSRSALETSTNAAPYLIPIPGPPMPIPPPAAIPLTGFMCCPAPGAVAGPPGITGPIIPAAPGSPGCPPPSMLASFPISGSSPETGGRRREAVGQTGGVAFYVTMLSFVI